MPATEAAVFSFAELNLRPLTRSAIAAMGIDTPTPIQAQALPALLAGRDLIGQARTGSGKTLAFAIPAIEAVVTEQRTVQVLVLTPTRELAVQVGSVFEQLAAGNGLRVALIYGGRAMGPQREALRRGAQVVVGTPGRVDDLYKQGALRLGDVRFFVLDEADEMLDRGFGPQVQRIVAHLPTARQTALFSATVPAWVHETGAKHLKNPVHVAVDPNPEDVPSIEHVAYDVIDGDKLAALRQLLDARGDGQMIVFGRTKHGVKKLAKQLEGAGYPVGALQGNLSQNARDRVMEEFRAGQVKILLATNVAARGLDITSVDAVINYELPESSDLLTHRVGRTGRMGRAGRAVTLLAGEDGAKWRQLERGLGVRIPRRQWTAAEAHGSSTAPMAHAAPTSARPIMAAQASSRPSAPAAHATLNRSVAHAPRVPSPAMSRPDQAPVMLVGGTSRRPSWPAGVSTTIPPRIEEPRKERGRGPADSNGFITPPPRTYAPRPGAPRSASRPASPEPGNARIDAPRTAQAAASPTTNGREDQGARSRHEIVCSGCGKTSTVGFQPDPTRPCYCENCFRDRRDPREAGDRAASPARTASRPASGNRRSTSAER